MGGLIKFSMYTSGFFFFFFFKLIVDFVGGSLYKGPYVGCQPQ